MTADISHTSIDCLDAQAMSVFWSGVLGFSEDPEDRNELGDEECMIFSEDGAQRLLFIEVPGSKQVKNRLHLDLKPAQGTRDEELERLLELGARTVDDRRHADGSGWVVLADPEANEFCILRSDAERTPGSSSGMSQPHDAETLALLMFLDAQRASVLAIVEGLPEAALRARTLPSGWSPLGLIEHLGHAERHWFQEVATGSAMDLPWPEGWDPGAPFDTTHTEAEVFAFYRNQCQRANALLSTTPLASPPRGHHHGDDDNEVANLRWIALHMIEETARHAGHLDVVRELLDGRTGLGPR